MKTLCWISAIITIGLVVTGLWCIGSYLHTYIGWLSVVVVVIMAIPPTFMGVVTFIHSYFREGWMVAH